MGCPVLSGSLNFVGFGPLKKSGGIGWLVPCCSVFLLIGLALDYVRFPTHILPWFWLWLWLWLWLWVLWWVAP
jgi:hypothetical protein